MNPEHQQNPVLLITGGARRIGRVIATHFHQAGFSIAIHYRHSKTQAIELMNSLNKNRKDSAVTCYADLDDPSDYTPLIDGVIKHFGRIDVLINNASTFFPTDVLSATQADWDLLFNSNARAPFFLSQQAAPHLKKTQGLIINITDIHAQKPMRNYPIYSAAKSALHMLTLALATELAPAIRVNSIAPGSVIWPEGTNIYSEEKKQTTLENTLLNKQVSPESIAETALFLAKNRAITAETIKVDGGRI